MKRTIIEKIIAEHSPHPEDVKPGNIVWMEVDVRTARDFGGANVVKNLEKYYPGEKHVADPEKTYFTFDTQAPANTIGYAVNQMICRDFARKWKLKVYDVNQGIGTHVGIEKGHIYPGITAVGTDSHLNIMGSVGAFGQGMGDKDIAFVFKTGKTWFEVPPTMKVILKGIPPKHTTPKDITLKVVGTLGSKGALGRAIEFEGEVFETMPLYGRITLASMTTEMGGIIAFMPMNDDVINFIKSRSRGDFKLYEADEGAEYVDVVEIDISDLEPMISLPGKPDEVVPVRELESKKIEVHSSFVGSCTNGRYEDIKLVADLLKGKKVKDGVMLKIVPATKEVYGQLLNDGVIHSLFESGAIISNPGCGGCAAGQIGMTGEGEVQVSTGNRNFIGKQGKGDTYLCSPATAAMSALNGYITSYYGEEL